jgi:hypothetical protein
LESEYAMNPKLKAIVFVKDRSVATYLKKILDFMFARLDKQRENNAREDNESSLIHSFMQSSSEKEIFELSSRLKCNFAIGF